MSHLRFIGTPARPAARLAKLAMKRAEAAEMHVPHFFTSTNDQVEVRKIAPTKPYHALPGSGFVVFSGWWCWWGHLLHPITIMGRAHSLTATCPWQTLQPSNRNYNWASVPYEKQRCLRINMKIELGYPCEINFVLNFKRGNLKASNHLLIGFWPQELFLRGHSRKPECLRHAYVMHSTRHHSGDMQHKTNLNRWSKNTF